MLFNDNQLFPCLLALLLLYPLTYTGVSVWPICESLIILQYIDEVWKHKYRLCSDDAHNRAKAMYWIDFFDKKIGDCGRKMWASKGEEQESGKKEFIYYLKLLENELGDKEEYYMALGKLKKAMEEPQQKVMAFINNMHSQLNELSVKNNLPSQQPPNDDASHPTISSHFNNILKDD